MASRWKGLYEEAIRILDNNAKKEAPAESQQVGEGETGKKECQEED